MQLFIADQSKGVVSLDNSSLNILVQRKSPLSWAGNKGNKVLGRRKVRLGLFGLGLIQKNAPCNIFKYRSLLFFSKTLYEIESSKSGWFFSNMGRGFFTFPGTKAFFPYGRVAG